MMEKVLFDIFGEEAGKKSFNRMDEEYDTKRKIKRKREI